MARAGIGGAFAGSVIRVADRKDTLDDSGVFQSLWLAYLG